VETDGDIEGQTHSYHQNRIAAVSQSITDTKQKQSMLEQQLQKHFDVLKTTKPRGWFAWFKP
jgi:septal ring factor EnvC (AmiA/AmiB activator)